MMRIIWGRTANPSARHSMSWNRSEISSPKKKLCFKKHPRLSRFTAGKFSAAAAAVERSGPGTTDRVQAVVRAYEQDLNNLLKRSAHTRREQLVEELRK